MTREEMLSYTAEDISKMNKSELLDLARAERKAIKDARYRLNAADIDSPAARYLDESGNISAKESMSVNELREQITRGRVILNYKTLYVGEAKDVETKMRGALSERLGEDLSQADSKLLWDILKRVAEDNQALLDAPEINYIPKAAQQRVFQIINDYNKNHKQRGQSAGTWRKNEIFKNVMAELKSDYREREHGASKERFYNVNYEEIGEEDF